MQTVHRAGSTNSVGSLLWPWTSDYKRKAIVLHLGKGHKDFTKRCTHPWTSPCYLCSTKTWGWLLCFTSLLLQNQTSTEEVWGILWRGNFQAHCYPIYYYDWPYMYVISYKWPHVTAIVWQLRAGKGLCITTGPNLHQEGCWIWGVLSSCGFASWVGSAGCSLLKFLGRDNQIGQERPGLWSLFA